MKIFALTASASAVLAVTSSIDCNDGNNGGCSHSCNADECTCPTCWTLSSDLITCQPSAGMAEISCSPSGMTLRVNECVVEHASSITLSDSDCIAVEDEDDSEVFYINTALDGCDTQYTINEDDDTVTFTNKLIAGPGIQGGIIISRPLAMSFGCEFTTFYEGVNLNYTADASLVDVSFDLGDDQPEAAFFSYHLNFYTDDTYTEVLDQETNVETAGNTIYAAIENFVSVDGLVFTIESCTVADHAIGSSFDLIEGQCPNSLVDTQVSTLSHAEIIEFQFTAFSFPDSDETSVLQLSCDVTVCDSAVVGTICDTEPTCGGRRRRRDEGQLPMAFKAEREFFVRR